MPYQLSEKFVADAFASGVLPHASGPASVKVVHIGDLVVTSHAIVATDPLVVPRIEPFTQRVPNGRHPVTLAIANIDGYERIAFARLQFSRQPAVSWAMAVLEGQDPKTLGPTDYFGYGVDGATGCFMDYTAGELMGIRYREEGPYFAFGDLIIEEMEKNYQGSRQWGIVHPIDGRDENIVCFTSGCGDGAFPSFFGFDANGVVAQLVTEFIQFTGPGEQGS